MPGGCIFAVSGEATPEKLAKLAIKKASFSLERIELEESFLTIGEDFLVLQGKELLNAFESEFFTAFSRSPALPSIGGRQEEGGVFSNLPDTVNVLCEKRSDQGLLRIPSITEEEEISWVVFVSVSQAYEIAGDFKLGSVSAFSAKL